MQDPLKKILAAVESGDSNTVVKLLTKYPELINCDIGEGGWLDSAIWGKHYDLTKTLIELGCNVNAESDLGCPLDTALSTDSPDLVELLLRSGAIPKPKFRPLIGAIIGKKKHSLELIKLLHQYGADLNSVYLNEHTGKRINALSVAIDYGRDDVIEYLNAQGCSLPDSAPTLKSPSQLPNPIIEYFETRFGPTLPKSLIEIIPTELSIVIHAIPSNDRCRCLTLFTSGMSNVAMNVPRGYENFANAELFIQLPAEWPFTEVSDENFGWPLHWLRELGKFPHQNDQWLGGEVAIITSTTLGVPLPHGFDSMLIICEKVFSTPHGRTIAAYRLFPLFPAERKLEMERGIGALLNSLDAKDISFVVDVCRKSAA